MNEHNENETLRAELEDQKRTSAALEHRLAQHEAMRSNAVDGLAIVQGTVERLTRRMIPIPAEVTASRQGHWLEESAILRTRIRASEEWMQELTKIVIEDHEMLREIIEMLKRGPQ